MSISGMPRLGNMSEEIQKGALYVVSTPIGNLDDITLRAVHILRSVDLIAAEDTRTTRVLLDHLGIRKPLISYFSYNEHRRAGSSLPRSAREHCRGRDGRRHSGISDPAYVVIREAVEAGISVIPRRGQARSLPR